MGPKSRSINKRGERMTDNKLEPCLFCGSNNIKIHTGYDNYNYIRCEVCMTSTGLFMNIQDAVDCWNGRVKDDRKI